MLRTLLFVATLPVLFWLATCAVVPSAHYSNAESTAELAEPIQWRHTVDGWETIDELQVEEPPLVRQPPIHPLTLLPLVVAVALSALLAFEPQTDSPAVETALTVAEGSAVAVETDSVSSTNA
ncbi:hypothetical protein M4951_25245 [Blastopirellula sp. J2-11]|uniref:hypothetical protein n=1 Tax=Blastopirellula sp. J2-11 TaxID=2943192 RepID=UPI0021CAADE8|nr:hypothetical protein [Blastopirellula sp. J2-11]UUO06636.1 hypothetical protein M4951_25245 [Blastopirellula sp. J2-11]